jgi:hypothetical protein
MGNKVLSELQEIKSLIAQLVGTADQPKDQQFSAEALVKASKLFLKMASERGEWISESDTGDYLKADWRAGSFIRAEFGFNAFIKNGRSYLYNKKAIQKLSQELKGRNIDLARYMEYKRSEQEFRKKLSANKKQTKGKRPYDLPSGLKDITTSSPPKPDKAIIIADLQNLKSEFFQSKLNEYVDIYRGTYAMIKRMYFLEKYLDSQIKRKCQKWCDDFNYANHALELLTKKRDVFIPVEEQDMIQL